MYFLFFASVSNGARLLASRALFNLSLLSLAKCRELIGNLDVMD